MDLLDLQRDPAAFQAELFIQTGSGEARLGDIMEDFQRERFAIANPALLAVCQGRKPPFSGCWDERSKGSAKDSDWAVNLLWLLMFSKRSLRIQVGAHDQAQADEVRQIIKDILRIDRPLNKLLSEVIDIQRAAIINTKTESVCEILTADKWGSHGSRPACLLVQELTHQPDDGFASTLMDNADKMPGCLSIIATNSGYLETWQEQWKKSFAESPRWRVLEYQQPAPWISPEALADAEKRNPPARFHRLWYGVWAAPGGDFFDVNLIDRAFDPNLKPIHRPSKTYIYVAGADLALTRDRAAAVLLGIHRKTKHIRLCQHRIWAAPKNGSIRIREIGAQILQWHGTFKLREVSIDPWQAALLRELLQRHHVPVELVAFTPENLAIMASYSLEVFADRQVSLYPDRDLRRDLLKAKLQERGTSARITFIRDKTGHADLGQAFLLALLIAKRITERKSYVVTMGAEDDERPRWQREHDAMLKDEMQLRQHEQRLREQPDDLAPLNAEIWLASKGRRGRLLF